MLERFLFSFINMIMLVLMLFFSKKIIYSRLVEPASLFVVFWEVMICSGVLLFDFNYSYLGLIYIIITIYLCYSISIVFKLFWGKIIRNNEYLNFKIKRSRYWLIITTFFGDLGALILIRQTGFSISQLFNLNNLMLVNNEMAFQRYSGIEQSSGILTQIFLIFEYLAPIIGGYHLASSKKKLDKFLSYLSLSPSIITVAIQNTKSVLIASVTLFIFSLIISRIYDTNFIKFNVKLFLKSISLAFLFLMALFGSMILRVGKYSTVLVIQLLSKFGVYAFGSVPAFDYWFNNHSSIYYGFGTNTFIGILNVLGLENRQQGVYSEIVPIGSFSTNVYTVFRGLIQDFGMVGSIIFIVILITLGTLSYTFLFNRRGIFINSFILLNVYFFIMQSFLISPWTYSSYMIALLLLIPYLWTVRRKDDFKNKK